MADLYTGVTVQGLYDNSTEAPLFGATGTAVPTSSILIGGNDGVNIQPLSVDSSGRLNVNASSAPAVDTKATGSLAGGSTTTVQISSEGTSAYTLQVETAGGYNGTVNFEASLDGTTWELQVLYPVLPDGTPGVSSTGASGQWQAPVGGFRLLRVRNSGGTTGTATVFLTAGQGQYSVVALSPNAANFNATVVQGTSPWVTSISGSVTVTGTVAVTQSTSPWITKDAADGTPGAVPPATATQVAGSDGTDLRVLKTDASGELIVQQGANWFVKGILTNNNAAPGAELVGVLPAVATNVPLAYTTGNQVLTTTSLGGAVRVVPVDEENASSLSYFSVDTGNTLKTVTTAIVFPLISIRSSSAGFIFRVREVSAFTDGTQELIQLIKNPQTLTGSTFAATAPTGSHVTVDTAATAVTIGTGTVVWSGFAATVPVMINTLMSALAGGTPGDIYTVASQKFGTGTSKAGGQIHWSEQAAAL